MQPHLFGSDYSVYVRIVRLCLVEKKIEYQITPVDIFAKDGAYATHLSKHPFGRIPYFTHGGFSLYETGAITRYIDESFSGKLLQPVDPQERARCNQIISICDNYAYPHLVWGVYVERVSKPARNAVTDQIKMADSLLKAQTCLGEMSRLLADKCFLASEEVTLADLYAAPMFDYFLMAPEGKEMIQAFQNLNAWWSRMRKRSSMIQTKPI